jgi:hypothetical protein
MIVPAGETLAAGLAELPDIGRPVLSTKLLRFKKFN